VATCTDGKAVGIGSAPGGDTSPPIPSA
jgi:hypothetical protein